MYLVTGGAGFIGSNIVAELCARAPGRVTVADRLRDGDKWRNLAKHEIQDIIAPEAIGDWLATYGRQVTAVVHMGAISSTTERDADLILRTNVHLSWMLWDWCARHEVAFLYASSAATYGDGALGFDDDGSIAALADLRPLNPYGWSKLQFDRRVARALAEGAPRPPQWVGLKFFNVYGPNEYHKGGMRSVVAQAFPNAQAGTPVTLFRSHRPDYADGAQLRDFVYVKDVARTVLWLLDNPGVSGLFNLGTGQARSFKDLVSAVFAAVGQPPRIAYVDTPEAIRARYQYFTQAAMDRLRDAGYVAQFTPLEHGVTDYVQNHLMRDDPYR